MKDGWVNASKRYLQRSILTVERTVSQQYKEQIDSDQNG